MIYLIDDKKSRQESDYGWNTEKLRKFSHLMTPVYTFEEIKEYHKREAIFSAGNIILFHESFFDNTTNKHNTDSVDIRANIRNYAAEKKGWVVFFSGSKSSRTLEDRVAHIPVSVLYENLEDFIEKVAKRIIDLRHLLYGGKNPQIEEELLKRLGVLNNQFDETSLISDERNFLAFTGSRNSIPIILEGAVERTFTLEEKYGKEITDSYLNDKVMEWLSADEVDNIFIPLCFGPSLSDYNGLQFACHVRCTDTINRLKPIFIYSFIDFTFLIDNEYFNLLKTKNVFLIDYTRSAFKDALLKEYESLTIEQLSKEIKKLKLDPPQNYEDNHSIANEWAIYRWASSIDASDSEIENITQKVNRQLYFKYLKTIYPKSKIPTFTEKYLKIKYSESPKILYIDDEADKGWYEILCKILYDINNLEFDYLDEELNSKTQDEIIKVCIDKITENNIDLVLLDFRLHQDDFIADNIQDVTGLILLKEIKKINLGIQVIIFSSTNKVWNLQTLQEAGADGFIMKESPENSIDSKFTANSILNFKKTIEKCLMKFFIKEIFNLMDPIAKLVKIESQQKPSNFSLSIQQPTIQSINQRIEIFSKLIYNYPSNLEWPFSTIILMIEEIVNLLYFDDGVDHVVEIAENNLFKKIKCNYSTSTGRSLSIKPNYNGSKYSNEEYVVPYDEMHFYNKVSNRDPFNFRLTCILHYRYQIPLGAEISKYYPFYKLRSASVMHVGVDIVAVSDLKLGIELLKELVK